MCCPLTTERKRILYFKQYPRIAKAYLRAGEKFRASHPDSYCVAHYDDVYEWFTRDVFYPRKKDWERVSITMFDKPDFKAFLEGQFGIDLTL